MTPRYMKGVSEFMEFVREKGGRNGERLGSDEPILCPCIDCLNLIQQDQVEVERHVNCRGMSITYTR